jgi:enterochelin esterase family protein
MQHRHVFAPVLLSLALAALPAVAEPAPQPGSAIDAIVAGFASHPVVAIAEQHELPQAIDFYVSLVRSQAFQAVANDIVIEFASRQSQPLLDRYVLALDSLPPDTLASVWRNTSKVAAWDSPVYARWLAAIRDANRSLPPSRRLRVLAGDTPVDWASMRTRAEWDALGPNDESFARVIEDEVLAKHRRALVVLGSNHLARGGTIRDRAANTTTRVSVRYPGAMEIVLMYDGWPDPESTEARIAREGWSVPSCVSLRGHWAGALPVAVRAGTFRLDSLADKLLYLGPVATLVRHGASREMLDDAYLDELDRRSVIEWGDSMRARHFLGVGRVVEDSIPSAAYGRTRRVWVYTPPDRRDSSATLGLLVCFDGGVYLGPIPMPVVLDTMISGRHMPPVVGVFVDDASSTERLADLANRERFDRFLSDELVPWVHARWTVNRDPRRAIVMGSSAGGLAAANVALARPDLFGNVLSQSGAFWRGNEGSNEAPFEWLTGRYAESPRRDLRFVLDVGSTESTGAMNGTAPSILESNRRLRDVLGRKGYAVTYTEVPQGRHATESWGQRVALDLETLMRERPGEQP